MLLTGTYNTRSGCLPDRFLLGVTTLLKMAWRHDPDCLATSWFISCVGDVLEVLPTFRNLLTKINIIVLVYSNSKSWSYLYLGSTWFESKLGKWKFWLTTFVVYQSSVEETVGTFPFKYLPTMCSSCWMLYNFWSWSSI